MNPQVGDIVQVSRVWRGTHIGGQVIRIFEKCPPYAEDYYLVKSQGVTGVELWFARSDIISIISEGYSHEAWNIAEDLEINIELSEGYDDGKEKESNYS